MLIKFLNKLINRTQNNHVKHLEEGHATRQHLMEQGSTFLWKLSNTFHHFGAEIVESHRGFENGNVHNLRAASAFANLYSLEQGEFLLMGSPFLVASPEYGFEGLVPLDINGTSYKITRQTLADILFAVMVLRMKPDEAAEYVLKVKPITLN